MAQSLKCNSMHAQLLNFAQKAQNILKVFALDSYLCFESHFTSTFNHSNQYYHLYQCTEYLLIISSVAYFLRNSCLMPPQFRMTLLSASMLIIHKPSGCEFCCKQKHLKRCTNFPFVCLSYIISTILPLLPF